MLRFLTFITHLLFMYQMPGTAIIALVSELRRPADSNPPTMEQVGKLPFLISFTVNCGVAPLLFLQTRYGQFQYTRSHLMATGSGDNTGHHPCLASCSA